MQKNQMKKATNDNGMILFGKKAGFVAGIALLVTVLKDVVELFTPIPLWIVVCYSLFVLAVFALALGTKWFDRKLDSDEISKFSDFLTVMSSAFFVIENLVIKCAGDAYSAEVKFIVIAISCTIFWGAYYLLHRKK